MNRLECLQLYPLKYRKFFYSGAPMVFIFFTIMILMHFFGMSFDQANEFWYIAALVGGIFTWYISKNSFFSDQGNNSEGDIHADPAMLKEQLERTNSCVKPLIRGLAGILLITMLLRFPFYREIGQVADIAAMMAFLALGSYFRETLHVYARTPGVTDEEISDRYSERSLFLILGWLALFFFLLKTVGLKGKMGNFWSGLPEIQMPNAFIIVVLAVYLVGVLGAVLQIYFQKAVKNTLASLFDACVAFGSVFPIVWFYPNFHPYLFTGLPAWIIQLSLMLLLVINSAGIYFSFQDSLEKKILGNSCLWFVKQGNQILAFIALFIIATVYVEMKPIAALVFYGGIIFVFAIVFNRRSSLVLALIGTLIAVSPILVKTLNGELMAKIEEKVALLKEIQQNKEDL